MSDFLNRIVSSFTGGQEGQPAGMSNVLQDLFAGGGLAGLVAKLQESGLGDQVKSWVGTGSNLPISGDQISQVFSAEQLQAWAQKAGISTDGLTASLSQFLPHAVDHATPDGEVPAQGVDIAGLVGKLFGGSKPA